MGYKIGQLTNNSVGQEKGKPTSIDISASTTVSTVITPKKYDLEGSSNSDFIDNCLIGTFEPQKAYSLTVNITKPTSSDNDYPNGIEINVLLADDNNDTIQKIDRLKVPLGNQSGQEYSNTLFFVPIKKGTKIIFEMVRGQKDYFHDQGQTARSWLTTLNHFIITDIKQLSNIKPTTEKVWKRIGFQSRPGSKIVINKVPITVGRSGIFELNVGVDITEFMVVENSAGQIDPFILDYTYITS